MLKKRLFIWEYFKVGENSKFAICNLCHASFTREGKTTKTLNATDLVQHLNVAHVDLNSFGVSEEVQLY